VGYDARALQSDLDTALPGEHIRVQTLGEGVLLTGAVSTTSVANRAKLIADKFAPDAATSLLTVNASQEVVLEVRVMEATRSALQDMGFAAAITSGNTTFTYGTGLIGNAPAAGVLGFHTLAGNNGIDASLQALEEKGIIRTLARPNLVAVSGGKASFLAGGEFPYPVPTGLNQITLEFRSYGVKLNFEPTVQDNGLIRLAVAPEVSQLDNANSIKINGVQVPGLITRKADTTVEIKDGDSLAIGGLFLHDYSNDIRQVPLLGNIPVLGTLFRSARWKRDETELVIIVTPRIVTARDFDKAAKTAGVSGAEPAVLDFLVNGKGWGSQKFTASFRAGRSQDLKLKLPQNLASSTLGAVASGDGVNLARVNDDTEGTDWASLDGVAGKQITIDLAGDQPVNVQSVNVSALLRPAVTGDVDTGAQNRFSALRSFAILACNATSADCTRDSGYQEVYRSPADAFPGGAFRPVAPQLNLRTFDIHPTLATHLRIVVLSSQCTGNPLYAGEQDNDPRANTDCATASPFRDQVRIAEVQVFGSSGNLTPEQ